MGQELFQIDGCCMGRLQWFRVTQRFGMNTNKPQLVVRDDCRR